MELKSIGKISFDWVKKYRYALLVVVIGIILMFIPTGNQAETQTQATESTAVTQTYTNITPELTEILASIAGVGNVRVMLTISVGAETVFQEDEDTSVTENGSSVRKETVLITGTDRNQEALIRYTRPPVYLGAVIVCQGGDQPAVKLAVIDAVSKATGLSSDKISVVKMK